jgi:hypothetical protein
VAGIPARPIRSRFGDADLQRHLTSLFSQSGPR